MVNPAAVGAEYLVYLPGGGLVDVDLSATSETLKVEWFNPDHGTTTDGGSVTGGSPQSFTAPFGGDAVLYIYSTSRPSNTRLIYLPLLCD
jgi:hypothetical protein